jgi:probable rRNA maturation factor
MLELEFENRVKSFRGNKKIFAEVFEKAVKVLEKLPRIKKGLRGTIMLTLVNDRQIHGLNLEYRGVDKPTDVLSFSYFGEKKFPGDDVVGEIVISVPAAKRQAKDHGKTLNQELQFLFLHGLLHVFGFDHIKKNERRTMFDVQDTIVGDKSWRAIAEAEAEEEY